MTLVDCVWLVVGGQGCDVFLGGACHEVGEVRDGYLPGPTFNAVAIGRYCVCGGLGSAQEPHLFGSCLEHVILVVVGVVEYLDALVAVHHKETHRWDRFEQVQSTIHIFQVIQAVGHLGEEVILRRR